MTIRRYSIQLLNFIGMIAIAFACGDNAGNPTGNPQSVGGGDGDGASVTPPDTWQEEWLDHDKLLELQGYNDHVAIYYDNEMDESVTWTLDFMTQVWKYVKSSYGNFGEEGRLYVVCHAGTTHIGRTGNVFDEATTYRSLSDVESTNEEWRNGADWCIDAHVHETGHVVEGSSFGVHGSPAFGIWMDSKWNEIFQYDVYTGIGRTADAKRLYDQYMEGHDKFPDATRDNYWFRDWFFPIYNQYGKTEVLASFFELLSIYFPKSGEDYARGLNFGEFVHFWSGAAKTDLSSLASDAFGWNDEWQAQLIQAREDFSSIVY